MATQLAETYYLKALDDYPWALSDALENLQYALSYDDTHPGANCLMAKLQMEQLKNYEAAENYLHIALATDGTFLCAYEQLLQLYLHQNRLKKAESLLKYMSKLPTARESVLSAGLAFILEKRGHLKLAKQHIKRAVAYAENSDTLSYYEESLSRIKRKLKWHKSVKQKGS